MTSGESSFTCGGKFYFVRVLIEISRHFECRPGATGSDFFDDPSFDGTRMNEMKKDDPAVVAKQGFEALMAGKDHVVGGALTNKLSVAINKFLTESGKAVMPRGCGEPSQKH